MTDQRVDHRTPYRRRYAEPIVDIVLSVRRHCRVGFASSPRGPSGCRSASAAFAWDGERAGGSRSACFATLVGLPLLVARWSVRTLVGLPGCGAVSNTMTGDDVPPPPPPFRARPGVLGMDPLRRHRQRGLASPGLYLLLKLPLRRRQPPSPPSRCTHRSSPRSRTGCGVRSPRVAPAPAHGSGDYVAQHHLDSTMNLAALAFAGTVLLILTPRVVRGVNALDRALVRTLLGPRP